MSRSRSPYTCARGSPLTCTGDVLGSGHESAAVGGLSDHGVDVDELGRVQRVGHLQPATGRRSPAPGAPGGSTPPACAWRTGARPRGRRCASSTASASSEMPPTGVLSSWLTLATKSRRTCSTRWASVRSSTSSSRWPVLRGATRARTVSNPRPNGPRASSRSCSRITPSRRTWRARSRSSAWARSEPVTMPYAYAAGLAFTTASSAATITALSRSTARTSATPRGSSGSGCTGMACCERSDARTASSATRPQRQAGDTSPGRRPLQDPRPPAYARRGGPGRSSGR